MPNRERAEPRRTAIRNLRAAIREWTLRLWGLLRGRRADDDIARELSLHLEMAEDALRRRGHSPAEAARLARAGLGGSAQALERMREQRGVPPLSAFWLDVKLGSRMLRKHWALTLIGGLAMAAAITLGAAAFYLLHAALGTTVPLDEGDRIVVIQPWDPATVSALPATVADFERWRNGLRSIDDIGGMWVDRRGIARDLVIGNRAPVPVGVAEISAAGFRLARVAPLLGRFLLDSDEAAGAPPVLVIGYDAWQSTFAADPDVIGRTVQLDGVFYTIVGVMPEGFAFPVNHQYWTSPRPDAGDHVIVFGRLAPGETLESAGAEVRLAGLEDTRAPDGSEPLRPRVVPYIAGLIGEPGFWIRLLVPLAIPLLLIPPCANIAILIYARTVARQGEFAARTALGATRRRIVAQVFIEVLVLALLAAGLALALTPKLADFLRVSATPGTSRMPFWMDFGFSYATIGYAAALAVAAALIAGAVPALRATGRWTLAGLHALGARSVPRLGRLWTSLVILQVALAAATLPVVTEIAWAISGPAIAGPTFAPDEYLTAGLNPDAGADATRFRAARDELGRRLAAEPGVIGITYSDSLPSQEAILRVEIEQRNGAESAEHRFAMAAFNRVDGEFFDAFGVRLLTGRGFTAADFEQDRDAAIVNRSFARGIFGDGNPLGQRIRILAGDENGASDNGQPRQWLEIVGVVADFSADGGRPAIYRPLTDAPRIEGAGPGPAVASSLSIHAERGVLPALPERLRTIAEAVDADLQLQAVVGLDVRYESYWLQDRTIAVALAGVMLGVIALSAAGVYTLMAFAVVQRQREIGIRSALGAPPWRLVAGIFRRVLVPIAVAAVAGAAGAVLIDHYLSPALFELREGGRPLPWVLPAAEAFIVLIGLLVVAGPARRTIRTDPVATLRDG